MRHSRVRGGEERVSRRGGPAARLLFIDESKGRGRDVRTFVTLDRDGKQRGAEGFIVRAARLARIRSQMCGETNPRLGTCSGPQTGRIIGAFAANVSQLIPGFG